MEVECEDEVVSFEDDDFGILVEPDQFWYVIEEFAIVSDRAEHLLVEIGEWLEPKFIVVSERPLPSSVMVRPVVAFPWKIDPFRMPELIAHKVEVSVPGCGKRDQPRHFMECDPPVDCE